MAMYDDPPAANARGTGQITEARRSGGGLGGFFLDDAKMLQEEAHLLYEGCDKLLTDPKAKDILKLVDAALCDVEILIGTSKRQDKITSFLS